jgi:hypothetical protein
MRDDPRQLPRREPVLHVARHPRLQEAALVLVHRSAAIDESLHDVPDLRDVKMRRREPAIGQPQGDMEIGMGRQRGAKVEECLHILDFFDGF